MTIEQKLIIGVDDIRGMRVECGHCRSALSFSLDETVRIPELCPACREPWIDTFKGAGQHTVAAVDQFIAALKQLRRVRAELKGEPTTVRFEFNIPPGLVPSA
jgi:hypothetical protein